MLGLPLLPGSGGHESEEEPRSQSSKVNSQGRHQVSQHHILLLPQSSQDVLGHLQRTSALGCGLIHHSILGSVGCDCVKGKIGVDVARADDRHLNVMLLHLSPHTVKEGLGCVFRGCLRRSERQADLALDAADRNHVSLAPSDHGRQERLCQSYWTKVVCLHHSLIHAWAGVHNGTSVADPGVIDEHVHMAKALQDLGGSPCYGSRVCEVKGHRIRLVCLHLRSPGSSKFLTELLQGLGIPATEHQPSASSVKNSGTFSAQARRGAGDDHHGVPDVGPHAQPLKQLEEAEEAHAAQEQGQNGHRGDEVHDPCPQQTLPGCCGDHDQAWSIYPSLSHQMSSASVLGTLLSDYQMM